MMKNLWKKICAWERHMQESPPLTFAMCIGVGAAVGIILLDNIAIGAGIGAMIGIALGVADKE